MSSRLFAASITFAAVALAGQVALSGVNAQERETLETIGRVVGIQGNVMRVEARDSAIWDIQLPDRGRNVTYRNTAGTKFLAPGVFVNFTGRFDKRGKMDGTLSSLKVFTPQSPDQLGVFPDVLGGAGFTIGTDPNAKPAEDKDALKSFQVSGRIAKVARNGQVSLQAGAQTVTFTVDPQAQIEVEVGTLELTRPGDTVNVDAWYYPQRRGVAEAYRIEVTGAQPLGVDPTAPAAPPKTPEKPAFTPGFTPPPKPGTPIPNTILPNPPVTPPKPGPRPPKPAPEAPKPGAPEPSPFDLK